MKNVIIIIVTGLVIGFGIMYMSGKNSNNTNIVNSTNINQTNQSQNVEVKNGIQYITITARGGYSPRTTNAKAGISTKLVIVTNNTYDCSAALKISSIGYQKVLPQTGETTIDIGTPVAGTPLKATCSMGMYNFVVNFN